jgi:hypothetical protein
MNVCTDHVRFPKESQLNFSNSPTKLVKQLTEVIIKVDLLGDGSGRDDGQHVGDDHIDLLVFFGLPHRQADSLSVFCVSSPSVDQRRVEPVDIVVFIQKYETLMRLDGYLVQ